MQHSSCLSTWLVKLILVMVSAYQLQLHGMASEYSPHSCDLWGFLHKGLQSRVSEWCSGVLAEAVYAELLRLSQPLIVITPLN